MYQTSEKFKNAVYGDSRTFLAKISDGTNSASEEILSLKQTSRSVADDCVNVGGAVSSYIEVKMWDPGFSLDGTEFEISIGMVIDSEPEWVPLGLFTVQKPKSDNGVVTFAAYDRIQTCMSGEFVSDLTYPCDGKAVLAEMSQKTGVPIDTANLPDGVMIPKRAVSTDSITDESGNPVTDTKYVTPFDGYTYREALSYIAQFYGMFATMDRAGNVVFRWYTVADCSISADRYYDDLTLGESVFAVEKITCQAGNDTLSAGEGTACIQLENPVMTQERLTAVYHQIKDLEFLPASVSFLGDPRIDVGDITAVTDKNGNVVKIPVMSLVQDYDGGLLSEVQSFGKVESESSQNKGPTDQKLDRLYKDLFLVKELVGEKASFGYVYSVSAKVRKLETETITADRIDVDGIFARDITAMNLHLSGNSTVDGNLITSGTISADRLDVNGIFAQDITASGTITGAVLKGGTIDGGTITGGTITGSLIYGADYSKFGNFVFVDGNTYSSEDGLYIQFTTKWNNLLPADGNPVFSISNNGGNLFKVSSDGYIEGTLHGSASSLRGAGINVIGMVASDTVTTWGEQLNSVHFINNESSQIVTDNPSTWGMIFNMTTNSEVHQIWCTQPTGALFHRGGNSAGWSGTWREIVDSSNYAKITGESYTVGSSWKALTPYAGDNATALGMTGYRYTRLYAASATISTSDECEKNILSGITEPYEKMFMGLTPILYMWKNFGNELKPHDRVHCGLGAQSMYAVAEKCGLSAKTLAAICRDDLTEPTADGRTERWGIAYEELIPLTIHMTQKALEKIGNIESSVDELNRETIKIAFLQEQIEQLYSYIRELKKQISERG